MGLCEPLVLPGLPLCTSLRTPASQWARGASQCDGRQGALKAEGNLGCAGETGHVMGPPREEKAGAILAGTWSHGGFPTSITCATVFVLTHI